ncbi:hypothetical protein ACSLO9_34635, partial [Escherichia coli]
LYKEGTAPLNEDEKQVLAAYNERFGKEKGASQKVQDFRDSVKRVVALLSGKNIPVAERGDDAYVRY